MGNEVCVVSHFMIRLHSTPYQEVIMREGDDKQSTLQKVKAVSCGGHMIDVITGLCQDEL